MHTMVHSLLNQKTYVAAAFLPLLPIRDETRGGAPWMLPTVFLRAPSSGHKWFLQ